MEEVRYERLRPAQIVKRRQAYPPKSDSRGA